MNVVYIGYFKMPDGTAAAQLMRGMIKITAAAGYQTTLIDVGTEDNDTVSERVSELDGAKLIQIRYPKSAKGELLRKISYKRIKQHIPPDSIVMFYNYSAWVMLKSFLDKKRYAKFIPMITEWYSAGEIKGLNSIPAYVLKKVDIDLRMKIITKKCRGLIVCSKYLAKHYADDSKTLIIPTVINYEQEKWYQERLSFNDASVNFVYAGSLGVDKDSLVEIMEIIKKASGGKNYSIRIIGVTREQFLAKYPNETDKADDRVHMFLGRLPHEQCIQIIRSSDYSILYRESNRVANAGFPTKFAESMACGVPQIVTDTSDIKDYIEQGINGLVISFDKEEAANQVAEIFSYSREDINAQKDRTLQMKLFDYKHYVEPFREFVENV